MGKLNPQIIDVEIGTRELRTVKIYPLSMHDQLQMTDLIVLTITQLSEFQKQGSDIEILEKIVQGIQDNLDKLLLYVTDENEKVSSKDVTNDQALIIAEMIYLVNYDSFSKNLKGLTTKMKGLIGALKKQSPKLSEATPDTV